MKNKLEKLTKAGIGTVIAAAGALFSVAAAEESVAAAEKGLGDAFISIAKWLTSILDWGLAVLIILLIIELFKFFGALFRGSAFEKGVTGAGKGLTAFGKTIVSTIKKRKRRSERAERTALVSLDWLGKIEKLVEKLEKATTAMTAQSAMDDIQKVLRKEERTERKLNRRVQQVLDDIDVLADAAPHKKSELNTIGSAIKTENAALVQIMAKNGGFEAALDKLQDILVKDPKQVPAAIKYVSQVLDTALKATADLDKTLRKLEVIEQAIEEGR